MSNPFRFSVSLKKLFSILVLAAFCTTFAPVAAFAQGDFDFSDDSGDDFNFSDDDNSNEFDFGDDTPAPRPAEPSFVMPDGSKPINFVFFEPVDGTPQKTLDALSEALVKHLGKDDFAEYDSVVAVPILEKLKTMDDSSRFDCTSGENYATCLSDIVCELGVNDGNIVVGRIYTETDTQPKISLELIQIATNTSVEFTEFETQQRLKKQEKDLEPAVYSLFHKSLGDIKDVLGSGVVEEKAELPLGQMIGGIVVGVAALGAIGTGIYFGLSANDYQDQVAAAIAANKEATGPSDSLLTQVATHDLQTKGEDQAMLANILYASGAVLAVVSVILFLVRSESSDELFAGSQDLFFSPTFLEEGAGVSAGFTF